MPPPRDRVKRFSQILEKYGIRAMTLNEKTGELAAQLGGNVRAAAGVGTVVEDGVAEQDPSSQASAGGRAPSSRRAMLL